MARARLTADHPKHIAQVILEVMANPALRAALGASGFRLQQRFTWRRTAADTLAVYEEAVRARQAYSGARARLGATRGGSSGCLG